MATGGEISGVEKQGAGAVTGLIDKNQKQFSDIAHEFVDDTHQSDIGHESIEDQEQSDFVAESTENHHQSDAVLDYMCCPCNKNDVTTDATHYCPECDVYYCKACLCDHNVLGKSSIAQWGNTAMKDVGDLTKDKEQEDKCQQHPQYTVTLYCAEHDVLCCQLCNATEHRLCKHMEKLSTAAETENISDSIQHVEDEVVSLEKHVETLTRNRGMRKQFVESSFTNYLTRLSEIQDEVNAKFDAVKEDARVRKQSHIDNFSTDEQICTNITETLKRCKETSKQSKDKQERFIRVKWASKWVRKKHEDVRSMLNESFAEVFQNIPRLQKVNALKDVTEAIHVRMAEMKFSIESTGDKNEVEVAEICQITNGNLVLADKANECMKQLDMTYTVISRHNLPDYPRGICAVGDSEVAVAMDNKVLIVAVATAFENIRTPEFDHPCTGVAYHNEQLFITYTPSCSSSTWCYCKAEIKIYDKSGNAIKQMTADIGEHRRSDSDNGTPICISEDGEKIYVAHRCGLVVLDSQGQKITSSKDYTYTNIVGLCVDNKGYLYSSKGGLTEVVKWLQEGTGSFKKVGTVNSSLDRAAGAIVYDKRLGRIVICQEKGSYVCLEKHTY